MSDIERKLTTILVADVVGFSKMMGVDEAGTLRILKACRSIIDGSIIEHHGRVFGSAGDSVVAEFSSPVQAVLSASEFQRLLEERNAHYGESEQMRFRIGINIGDVIIDGDNLYGEGVNVAARLEAIAEPGSVCVSSKVYEEVKRKLDLLFVDGGTQELKNIIDPVAIYHMAAAPDAVSDVGAAVASAAAPAAKAGPASERPTVAVTALKVISGDEEIQSLAAGLREDIVGGLAKQTAIAVIGADEADAAADFRLEGSVRAAGQRLRLSFTLLDTANRSQVWSERYDRQLDDIFDLEDEISESVIAVVRLRIKARAFEQLRNTDNATLTVPDLLSKAAGYFVHSYGHNDDAGEVLALAAEKAPENSMALAMTAFCRYRTLEFSPLEPPDETKEALLEDSKRALSLDPSSYFARLIAALARQDLEGDFETALLQAETALELNSGFSQAQAMAAIARCHLGELERGIEMLQRAVAAAPEDPHRYRHLRELALAHSMAGNAEEAVAVINRVVQQAPELSRNRLVQAAILGQAGRDDAARQCVEALVGDEPGLRLRTMRQTRFADQGMAARYAQALAAAGLFE